MKLIFVGLMFLAGLGLLGLVATAGSQADVAQAQAAIEAAQAAQDAAKAAQIAAAGQATVGTGMVTILLVLTILVTLLVVFAVFLLWKFKFQPALQSRKPPAGSQWLPGPNAQWGRVGDGQGSRTERLIEQMLMLELMDRMGSRKRPVELPSGDDQGQQPWGWDR